MRHVMRYKHTADFGMVYYGEAEPEYLHYWCERVALNFGSSSLGHIAERKLRRQCHAYFKFKTQQEYEKQGIYTDLAKETLT